MKKERLQELAGIQLTEAKRSAAQIQRQITTLADELHSYYMKNEDMDDNEAVEAVAEFLRELAEVR